MIQQTGNSCADEAQPRHGVASQTCKATSQVNARELICRIRAETSSLSRQFKMIATYVLQHSDCIYLERIQDVAGRCGTQPSTVVRFAKRFGFSGFHDFKMAFLNDMRYVGTGRADEGGERVGRLEDPNGPSLMSCTEAAFAFIDGACHGVSHLQRDVQAAAIQEVVARLAEAQVLWVVGARQAFPVACYLAQAMQSLSKPVQWVHFTGGMQEGQLRGLRPHDAVIAIGFEPYADETVHAAQIARTLGVPVVSITDAPSSPLVPESAVSLLVQESATLGLRALTNTMTLAQSLVLALAFHMKALDEVHLSPSPHDNDGT